MSIRLFVAYHAELEQLQDHKMDQGGEQLHWWALLPNFICCRTSRANFAATVFPNILYRQSLMAAAPIAIQLTTGLFSDISLCKYWSSKIRSLEKLNRQDITLFSLGGCKNVTCSNRFWRSSAT